MKIAITGIPGVGKTSVAEALAEKLNYRLVRVNDLAERLNAYIGYDEEFDSKILDMNKLKREIKKLKGNVIIEGHVSHEFPVDVVIVLRCEPSILEERLKERYPDKPLKVKENVEAEILGVITSEAIMQNKRVYEVDTTHKKIEETVEEIIDILDGKTKGYEVGRIDWLEKYQDRLVY
ncbi:MAG: adenylate kinase family protein [Candidatus Heimdallarchaeaceae archaeon]